MLDDEGIEGFNVGVESEELVFRVTGGTVQGGGGGGDHAGVRGTVRQPSAIVVVVSPDQLLARGLRRDLVSVLARLIELFPPSKHFPEWILANNGFPIDSVQNCFASEIPRVKICNSK